MFAVFLVWPTLAHSQTEGKFASGLTSDEQKDLKALKDDWAKHEKIPDFNGFQAKCLVMSQMILGRLGYGTPFTGATDERTKEAIKSYQTDRGLTPSGLIDAETFWSLTRDSDFADKSIVSLAPFDLKWYSDYVEASGAWDRINDRESYLQSSNIQCDQAHKKCTEADAMIVFNVLVPKKTDFVITKWDEFEIVAEDTTPDCERDELRINHQEKSVTIISTPTYKNATCAKTLGKPETVTDRLVSGEKISADRAAILQRHRKSLYLMSPNAKAILDKKD
jgi:Putative peptidoglycan binding domain